MIAVDQDQSGSIDYSEFVIATLNKKKLLSKNNLEVAFKAFDTDGSGTISKDELKLMLGSTAMIKEELWE
jgi:Ca2+-binding EF-hand superfamily protein